MASRQSDRPVALSARLTDGSCQPPPHASPSSTAGGKDYRITVPTAADRVVHRSLRKAVEPLLERDAYPPWMFGWHRRAARREGSSAEMVKFNTQFRVEFIEAIEGRGTSAESRPSPS
ncbi:hypothetical protein GCM10023178_26630 [Actinomadura luteofluorescens]